MPVPNGSLHHDDEDIDYSDIEAKYDVELEEGFDNILVVDGVPVIDNSKLEKLLTKISKEFGRKGAHIKTDNIFVPWDEKTGKSKGFVFMEFKNADDAIYALNVMNGHPFDAKHTFLINRFTDIEKFRDVDETFVEPEPEQYQPREHLRAWLTDPQGRDQYVTYRQDDVTIHWHGKPSKSEVAYERKNWTDLYVSWSPLGTMLATLHRQGVRLWGGPSWSPVQKFAHPLVKLIDFSPNERYVATWSNEPIVIPEGAPQGPQYLSHEDEGNSIAVWDIKTGNLLRTFPTQNVPASSPGEDGAAGAKKQQMQWPALKWSADDRYVARVTPGQQISVYELPGMGLLDKKSIKIDGVVDFEWRPIGDRDREEVEKETKGDVGAAKGKKRKENMLVYWTPEVGNQPARVSLMSIPDRTVLRSKNLFNVTECKLYWQNQGDFLCVKVDRHTKTKKSIFCNLEIFRVREKDFPVEVVELKDTVTDFSWEPKGERFAIVSSNDPNVGNPAPGITIKTDVSFYQHERGKGDFKLLKALPSRTSNTIRWSPRGRHVVLATVGSSSKSELEFWDLDFNTDDISGRREPAKEDWGTGISHLGTADHYGVTDVEWDPSGRYLATSASAWRHTLENGYALWDFKGQDIQKQILDRFKQFLWRPRPRTLLTKEQQRQIRKNLKEYSRAFDEDDAAEESNVSAELIAQRKRLVDEWNAWRAKCRKELGDERQGVNGRAAEEEQKEEIAIELEEVLEETEEVVEDSPIHIDRIAQVAIPSQSLTASSSLSLKARRAAPSLSTRLPMTADDTQSTVPPSSTLWAQASKEWVIPAKPKPGRKPKKDAAAAPKETHEVDSKGRRIQNRAAQRAFRERKQSQLADLQARVQSYEQGEIERNVALQQISKRLKEENEQLKGENASLKEEIARLKEGAAAAAASAPVALTQRNKEDGGKSLKRWRDDSVCSALSDDVNVLLESTSRKRFRAETDSPVPSSTPCPQYAQGVAYMPSPPSMASSPDSNGLSRTPFSPLPFAPLSAPSGSVRATSSYSTSAIFSPPSGDGLKSFDILGGAPPFDSFDCGLCTDSTPCVCREIAMQHAGAVSGMSGSLSEYGHDYLAPQNRTMTVLKVEDADNRVANSTSNIIEIPSASDDADAPSKSAKPSHIKDTPSYQHSKRLPRESLSEQQANSNGPFQIRLPSPEPSPASATTPSSRSIPLRMKNTRRTTSGKVWQLNPVPPMCSGDPSNCPACKDDDFGKAFCRALGDSASTVAPACASCPNPEACGKAPRSACASGPSFTSTPSSSSTMGGLKLIELTPARPEQDRAAPAASPCNSSRRPSVTLPSLSIATAPASSITTPPASSATGGKPTNPSETIPVNEAWARLKSHPNIAFADLSMLADVVARRTKCSGPVAVINPAPGSITPERDAARSPAAPESEAVSVAAQDTAKPQRKDSNPILLTDPHAHFRAQEQQRAQITSTVTPNDPTSGSTLPAPQGVTTSALSLGPRAAGRPALVPQEELRECGRRRIREVDAAGVREALRILDAQFGKHY